jgi:hypothetical protein
MRTADCSLVPSSESVAQVYNLSEFAQVINLSYGSRSRPLAGTFESSGHLRIETVLTKGDWITRQESRKKLDFSQRGKEAKRGLLHIFLRLCAFAPLRLCEKCIPPSTCRVQ